MATSLPHGRDLKIKTRIESADGENIIEATQKCDLCKVKMSKYTCPKCNLRYCGIECYKCPNHRKCSEDFYKEQVMTEIKHMKSTDPDQKRIMDMLKRVTQSENDVEYVWNDNEAVEILAKRMEDIDLDAASFDEMYCRLTEREKKLFESVVQSGEVEIVDACVPWWIQESEIDKLKECHDVNGTKEKDKEDIKEEAEDTSQEDEDKDEEDNEEEDDDDDGNDDVEDDSDDDEEEESVTKDLDAPDLLKDIPPLTVLLPNKRPSEKLPYSVIELVAIYCFIYRVYNGELKESLLEVLDNITTLSPVLTDNHYYEGLEICLMSLIQRIKRSPAFKDNIDPIRVSLSDLSRVVSSNFSTGTCKDDTPMSLLCISDLYNLFDNGVIRIKGLKGRTNEIKERKILYHRITKKLLFMASWLSEHSNIVKDSGGAIKALQRELLAYWDSVNEDKRVVEEYMQQLHDRKKLIEVL